MAVCFSWLSTLKSCIDHSYCLTSILSCWKYAFLRLFRIKSFVHILGFWIKDYGPIPKRSSIFFRLYGINKPNWQRIGRLKYMHDVYAVPYKFAYRQIRAWPMQDVPGQTIHLHVDPYYPILPFTSMDRCLHGLVIPRLTKTHLKSVLHVDG